MNYQMVEKRYFYLYDLIVVSDVEREQRVERGVFLLKIVLSVDRFLGILV